MTVIKEENAGLDETLCDNNYVEPVGLIKQVPPPSSKVKKTMSTGVDLITAKKPILRKRNFIPI